MTSASPGLVIAFPTAYGRFTIRPVENESNLFCLEMAESAGEVLELGRYRSINDAILSVAHQETGYLKWDGLCLGHVPYKVHDITCWEFDDFLGTNEERCCS